MSVDLDAKSARARYIRVAAIERMIIAGNWNIYIAEGHKSLSRLVEDENVRGSAGLFKLIFSA